MILKSYRLYAVLTALCCVIPIVSCSKDPEQQKRAYFASGNRYFEQKKYAEAVVEYRNAVRIDAAYGEAHERLSAALFEKGDVPEAARALVRAADLLPG